MIKKVIRLVFSRETLRTAFEHIHSDLQNALSVIEKESELMREDNLARGEIVRFARASATLGDDIWMGTGAELKSRLSADDPSEYWAAKPEGVSNFVTDTISYPWMPTDVSEENDEVPF